MPQWSIIKTTKNFFLIPKMKLFVVCIFNIEKEKSPSKSFSIFGKNAILDETSTKPHQEFTSQQHQEVQVHKLVQQLIVYQLAHKQLL